MLPSHASLSVALHFSTFLPICVQHPRGTPSCSIHCRRTAAAAQVVSSAWNCPASCSWRHPPCSSGRPSAVADPAIDGSCLPVPAEMRSGLPLLQVSLAFSLPAPQAFGQPPPRRFCVNLQPTFSRQVRRPPAWARTAALLRRNISCARRQHRSPKLRWLRSVGGPAEVAVVERLRSSGAVPLHLLIAQSQQRGRLLQLQIVVLHRANTSTCVQLLTARGGPPQSGLLPGAAFSD